MHTSAVGCFDVKCLNSNSPDQSVQCETKIRTRTEGIKTVINRLTLRARGLRIQLDGRSQVGNVLRTRRPPNTHQSTRGTMHKAEAGMVSFIAGIHRSI